MPDKKPKQNAIRTRVPTAIQEKILKVKHEHPDLSTTEIGAVVKCNHTTVSRCLARYGIKTHTVDDFKTHRADIFAGLQERILSSCTDDDIKKAPLGSRVLAACQIYDKERLERGQSTGNMAVGLSLTPALQDAVNHIISRSVNVDKPVDNTTCQPLAKLSTEKT